MALFGFGKKKKTEDPISETQKEMMQEPTAEKPDGSASGVSASDEDELEQLYRMGLESQDDGNDAAAFQYLKKAAEGGHVLAQFTLGTIFERGSDVVYQDIEQAVYWYGLAAEQGDPGAQFNLGYLFMQSSDRQEEGASWMKKAAEQGDEAAQEYLASLTSETERKQKMRELRGQNIASAKKLLGAKQLYLIYSTITNRPFILEEGDYYVLIFSDEGRAREKCADLSAQGYRCNPSRFLKKDFIAILGSFYLSGCNALRFDKPDEQFDVYLYDLVKINRKNHNSVKPVENPKLVRSMLLLRQEAGKTVLSKEPDQTALTRFQSDISSILYQEKAELIMPYILTDKDGEKVRTPLLIRSDAEGAPVRAVIFSGDDIFTRFKRNNVQIRRKVITAGELAQVELPEGVGSFIVDPDSAKLLIQITKKQK